MPLPYTMEMYRQDLQKMMSNPVGIQPANTSLFERIKKAGQTLKPAGSSVA